MRICLVGSGGQLGHHLLDVAGPRGIFVRALAKSDLEIGDEVAVDKVLNRCLPFDLLVNAAAYTKVDLAEEQVAEAFAANAKGPGHLAAFCRKHDLPLIHISTDYVFDGSKRRPYLPDDPCTPVGVYGKSKAEGEQRVLSTHSKSIILRCSWLFGKYGSNFVKTMISLGRQKESLSVVDDQVGCPTYAGDLAGAILKVAGTIIDPGFRKWGVYHYCNAGSTTWYGMASKIFEIARGKCCLRIKQLKPISSDQYPPSVIRPSYSALDCSATKEVFGIIPRPWQEALEEVVEWLCDTAADDSAGAKDCWQAGESGKK